MNLTGWIDRLKEFDKEHGDFVIVNGMKYFADGAMREVGDQYGAPLCAGCLPPSDERGLRHRMRTYWEAKLDAVISDNHSYRSRCLTVYVTKAGSLPQQNVTKTGGRRRCTAMCSTSAPSRSACGGQVEIGM